MILRDPRWCCIQYCGGLIYWNPRSQKRELGFQSVLRFGLEGQLKGGHAPAQKRLILYSSPGVPIVATIAPARIAVVLRAEGQNMLIDVVDSTVYPGDPGSVGEVMVTCVGVERGGAWRSISAAICSQSNLCQDVHYALIVHASELKFWSFESHGHENASSLQDGL
jgi:hypothetical protein